MKSMEPMESLPHDEPRGDPYDDLFEAGWDRPKQTSRLTLALVAALLVVLGFAGGVLTQRAFGGGNAPTTVTGGPGAENQVVSPAQGGGVRRAGPQGGGG
jgi:hypothetical protein